MVATGRLKMIVLSEFSSCVIALIFAKGRARFHPYFQPVGTTYAVRDRIQPGSSSALLERVGDFPRLALMLVAGTNARRERLADGAEKRRRQIRGFVGKPLERIGG